MAEVVISQTGNAQLYDPERGEAVEVPEAQLSAALQSGMVPVTADQARTAALKEHFDKPVQAFFAGAARGLTLGLSDVALTQSGMFTGEKLAAIDENSGIAGVLGEAIGTVGSIALPGGPLAAIGKVAGTAGRVATSAVSRATGQAATRALPRILGAGTAEGVAGLAIGTGQVASDMALKRREASLGAFAEGLGEYAVAGAGIGVGLAGLGQAGRFAIERGQRAIDRLGLNTKATRNMMARHRELTEEIEFLRKVPESATSSRVAAMQVEYEQLSRRLIVDKMARVGGAVAGAVALGGLPGSIVGAIAGPRILEASKRLLRPVWEHRGAINAVWKQHGQEAVAAVASARPAIYRYGPMALDVAYAFASPQKAALHIGGEYVAHKVGTKARQYAISGYKQAKLIASPSALDALTPEHAAEAAQEIHEIKPGQAELDVMMSAPSWVEKAHVDELSQEAARGVTYLQSVAPKPQDGRFTGWKPTVEETHAFNLRLRGTMQPEAALIDLSNRQLRPETVEAVAAVHPAALDEQRRWFRAEFERAVKKGRQFTAGERLQVATFLGDHRVAHPVHQPEFRAVLDELQAGAVQERGAMRTPRRSIRFADRNQGRAQAALEGSV